MYVKEVEVGILDDSCVQRWRWNAGLVLAICNSSCKNLLPFTASLNSSPLHETKIAPARKLSQKEQCIFSDAMKFQGW